VVDGNDPVHTPENTRAGLTRYLCEGWHINDIGQLASQNGATGWSASVGRIPNRLHDGPRRLMLGASLQSRAVQLVESERPNDLKSDASWISGRNLRASFTMLGGWTHEDAIVLSESAARKLSRRTVRIVRVLVPSVATRVEIAEPADGTLPVHHGQILARAFIDAFALGLRRHEAEEFAAESGWIEVALPTAFAPIDGDLCRVTRQALRTPFWREMITFEIERVAPVRIGDKLSTRHGIKGVVSRILPDDEMPSTVVGRAEIVLSPFGIIRRGAMGQLREAASLESTNLPRAGSIFVMRQPQDADVPERCRVRGVKRSGKHLHHGQRYGEMEFWALMAHGAPAIAKELLSVSRSTAPWIEWESKIEPGNHRKLATRALNRYLASAGVQIDHGRLISGKEPLGVFNIEPRLLRGDAREKLEDAKYFCEQGGLGKLSLGRSVKVVLTDGDEPFTVEMDYIYVVPPWLRPSSPAERHKLTRAYWRLMTKLAWPGSTKATLGHLVKDCLDLILHDSLGAGGFLRREVLGRRLTRSARAVVVPRPDLRIDQIAIPSWMANQLYEGLPDTNRRLILVNRNPTLHRRGLLALRPMIEYSNAPHVFGLPLGILRAFGADFDGDQVSIVALETDEALSEAEGLLPGSLGLRSDPFRPGRPAFPFAGELVDSVREGILATDSASTQEKWCRNHQELQKACIDLLGDGWEHPLLTKAIIDNLPLWRGLDETAWRALAAQEMEKVLRGVRRKGQLGGVLRRELYRRQFINGAGFSRMLQALQAVTERITQTALSTKTGSGATTFSASKYFQKGDAALLDVLDETLDPASLASAVGLPTEPAGLLAWLARPNARFLQSDPRLAWFLS
jgi:hypothetical protein